MKKFIEALLMDESGTAVTEWVVAASIMAMAGIATFAAIGEDVAAILGKISTEVNTLEASVN
jgi:Flp pilus assembly pilin Flp